MNNSWNETNEIQQIDTVIVPTLDMDKGVVRTSTAKSHIQCDHLHLHNHYSLHNDNNTLVTSLLDSYLFLCILVLSNIAIEGACYSESTSNFLN